MKTIIFFLLIMLSGACKKKNECINIPSCIQAKIDQNRFDPSWEVGSIGEYTFQGKTVYAFQPDHRIIADGATIIYGDNCVEKCSVGGFGGPAINQCNGENFYEKSVLVRTIWVKP